MGRNSGDPDRLLLRIAPALRPREPGRFGLKRRAAPPAKMLVDIVSFKMGIVQFLVKLELVNFRVLV